MNARMSREMETMMDFMQTEVIRVISCAINERIMPEIQNKEENSPLNQHGVEPCASANVNGTGNVWKSANTKLTKQDSRSACDLRDHTDFTPYTFQMLIPFKGHSLNLYTRLFSITANSVNS